MDPLNELGTLLKAPMEYWLLPINTTSLLVDALIVAITVSTIALFINTLF